MAASDSRKKPDGTRGCEIWMKIGGASPADYKECDYLTTDTRTPHVVIFDGTDAGKTLITYCGGFRPATSRARGVRWRRRLLLIKKKEDYQNEENRSED